MQKMGEKVIWEILVDFAGRQIMGKNKWPSRCLLLYSTNMQYGAVSLRH
jgi:hypothetical protein